MEHVKNLPEDRRRILQEGAGLTVVKNAPERNSRRMDTNQSAPRPPSRAQQTLEHLASSLGEPPTFKQVAVHELKRAAVWAPIFASTMLGLMWMQRRVFLKSLKSPVI